MEVLFLGSAAAEGWPAPFCSCHGCREARKLGGKDIRSRAGALIDNVVKIDYGPDVVGQLQRVGRDLTSVSTLLFTHEHDDHCVPSELQFRQRGFVTDDTVLPPLTIYGNRHVLGKLKREHPDPAKLEASYGTMLEPFKTVRTADDTAVLPLPASHTEGALLLRIERAGKRLLWGHDTGLFPRETMKALAGVPLDVAVFDCTYGPADTDQRNHMGFSGVLGTVADLRANGAVTPSTKLVATHFSHNGGMLHNELVEYFTPHGIIAAYDGMVIDV